MALVSRTFSWRPNPDGSVDGHYPAGDKNPQVAVAAWNEIALDALRALIAQRTTGSSLTQGLAQYATGSGLGSATYSVQSISGTALAGIYAISGANLTSPGTTAGAGFLRLGITVSGNTVYSLPIAWAWAASVVDVLPPTVPANLSGVSETGQVTLTWDASTDPPDGAIAASGVDHYDVRLGSTIVGTATPAGGFNQPSTTYNVGSGSSPAATVNRTGADYAITAEGVFDLTADRGILEGWQIAGDFSITTTITSLGTPAANSRSGIAVRASLAAGAVALYAYYRYSATTPSFRITTRASTDASTTNPVVVSSGIALPLLLKVERVGNTLNTYRNGVLATSQTLALPSSVYVTLLNASQAAGVSQTVNYSSVAVQVAQRVSHTHTTSVGGSYSVRAVDVAGNPSAYSSAVSVMPIAVQPAVKWHPGHYVLQTSPSSYSSSHITEIGAMPNVVGWSQCINWSTIETSRGVYSRTFIDGLLALCQANGKRLVLQIMDRNFSGGNPLPAYLATEANGGGGWYVKTNGLFQAKIYLPAIMDRLLALYAWLGATYDSEAYFEGVCTSESSLQEITAQSDYSESAYLAQYIRMCQTIPTYFPHTNVWALLNFGFNQSSFPSILAAMAAARCGFSTPDCATGNTDNSDNGSRASRGLVWNGSAWVSGGIDYRGVIPIAHDVEGPELGGKELGFTMTQMYNHSYNTNKDNHVFWLRKTFTLTQSNLDLYWDNTQSYATTPRLDSVDIKTWLNTVASPTRLTAPSVYASVGTSLASILFHNDYTGGVIGAVGPSANGYYAAQAGSVYDASHVEAGFTRTLKQTATGGVDDPTVGTSYTLAQKLAKGDEFWHSVRVFIPSGYSFASSPHLKWFRYRTETPGGSNKGYADIYFDPNGDGAPARTWKFIKEQVDVWKYFDQSAGVYAPVLDTWETYDFYVKFSDVPVSGGGSARVRFWKNKVLIGDLTDAQTLTSATDLTINALTWTYWNGNAPQTQSLWLGHEAYAVKCAASARDDTPWLTQDAAGNRLIALGL